MRPKKRIVVMTTHGELRFVLRNRLMMTVSEEDGTGDDHPGRPFDLAILDGRDSMVDLHAAALRLQKIVGPRVPLLLLAFAAQSTEGLQVNRVLYRELKGAPFIEGVVTAVCELTRRKRGPRPVIKQDPPPPVVNRVDRMMLLAEKVA